MMNDIQKIKNRKNKTKWIRFYEIQDQIDELRKKIGNDPLDKTSLKYAALHQNKDAEKLLEKKEKLYSAEMSVLNRLMDERSVLFDSLGISDIMDMEMEKEEEMRFSSEAERVKWKYDYLRSIGFPRNLDEAKKL